MSESLPVSNPTDVYMGQRIDSRLTSSGQPTEEQISAIKALGVTHIVNLGLHTHEKALPDEAERFQPRDDLHPHSRRLR